MNEELEGLSRKVITSLHDLAAELDSTRVRVLNLEYAQNSIHLARDAALDMRAMHALTHDLIDRRSALMAVQIEERIFHGPNHNDYHRLAEGARAATSAGHQHAKRLLNQCAYLTDAFMTHGTALRCGSFGKQYQSLERVDRSRVADPRSQALLELLSTRGEALEVHNNYRDRFIEHDKPRRTGKQPRPALGGATIGHHERDLWEPARGHVVEIQPGWVHIQDYSAKHRLINIFHVHAQGVFKENEPLSDDTFLGVALETEVMSKGHFRHTDYHGHTWIAEDLEDDDDYPGLRTTSVSESDFDQVFRDVMSYMTELVRICRTFRI